MAQSEPEETKRLEALADHVREKSRAGGLVRLDEACRGMAVEVACLTGSAVATTVRDLRVIREGAAEFLYSDRYMTSAYAEAAARAEAGDRLQMIAAAVRFDSATYPRPTPVETFQGPPYLLSDDDVNAAVERMQANAEFADIRPVLASDGRRFLYSLRHIGQSQAEAVAERLAVGQSENP
jgi:hypothetical protein